MKDVAVASKCGGMSALEQLVIIDSDFWWIHKLQHNLFVIEVRSGQVGFSLPNMEALFWLTQIKVQVSQSGSGSRKSLTRLL